MKTRTELSYIRFEKPSRSELKRLLAVAILGLSSMMILPAEPTHASLAKASDLAFFDVGNDPIGVRSMAAVTYMAVPD